MMFRLISRALRTGTCAVAILLLYAGFRCYVCEPAAVAIYDVAAYFGSADAAYARETRVGYGGFTPVNGRIPADWVILMEWLVFLPVSCGSAIAIGLAVYGRLLRQRRFETRCSSCGRVLRGLTIAACPACGTPL